MDDIQLIGNGSTIIKDLVMSLYKQFHMQSLGSVSYFLGIQITAYATEYHLNQFKYILELLKAWNVKLQISYYTNGSIFCHQYLFLTFSFKFLNSIELWLVC